jgi:ribosomal protein S18 acetylase RimI-like enzyme
MEIRRYRPDDLDELYDITVLTGDAGEDATRIYDDDRLLGHVFVGPYATHQSDLAFVATDPDGVAGYVLGARDARALETVLDREWWPDLRRRYPLDRSEGRPDHWLVERIHRPVLAPDEITDRYPSEFHVDLLSRCRGHGVGRRLIDRLLTELRAADSPGVHCGVDPRNERAIGFYEHLGFERIERSGGPLFVLGL